ncbi:MAG: flavoprotein, partial [Burkholderiaceae bacterium]
MAQDSSKLIGIPANMPPWGLEGKRILVAVSAGVAAYKTCILVRDLMRAGANIKIVMTEAARTFVSCFAFVAFTTKS